MEEEVEEKVEVEVEMWRRRRRRRRGGIKGGHEHSGTNSYVVATNTDLPPLS